MKKQLKKWNGRGNGKYNRYTLYVAAYSKAEAVRIVSSTGMSFSLSELNNYYNYGSWGTVINLEEPTEPAVWIQKNYTNQEPTKIY